MCITRFKLCREDLANCKGWSSVNRINDISPKSFFRLVWILEIFLIARLFSTYYELSEIFRNELFQLVNLSAIAGQYNAKVYVQLLLCGGNIFKRH